MKFLFILDPLDSLKAYKDTSVAMMRAAQARGHAVWSCEQGDLAWQGQVALGFTYAFTENTQLDWGCNFGVTESAPDFNPFLGFSFRF